MRFKEDIVFARTPKSVPVYIIPTDDQRIKFVVTLYSATAGSFIEQIQNNIATMAEQEAGMELLLPTFKVQQDNKEMLVGTKVKITQKGAADSEDVVKE